MPTFQTIIDRATALGYPIAHTEFIETKKNPTPDPPFVVWLSKEIGRGADNKNNIRETEGSIELYTDRVEDPEIETRIEEEVLFDVEYLKYKARIEDENMVQTAYDFTIIEKRR